MTNADGPRLLEFPTSSHSLQATSTLLEVVYTYM